MRKINDGLAIRKGSLQVVSDIKLSDDFEFRIGCRACDEGLTHAALGTVDEQSESGHKTFGRLRKLTLPLAAAADSSKDFQRGEGRTQFFLI